MPDLERSKKSKAWQPSLAPWPPLPSILHIIKLRARKLFLELLLGLWSLYTSHSTTRDTAAAYIQCPF